MSYPFRKARLSKCSPPKRVIVVAAEGEVTEPDYFTQLNSMSLSTIIAMVPNWGNGSDPQSVLRRMEDYLSDYPLEKNNEAWIVIDQDKWPKDSLEKVSEWVKKSNRHHCALSIRRFEDWLLLHVKNDPPAKKAFKKHIAAKNKDIPEGFVTKKRVMAAMEEAKRIYKTPNTVGNVFELIKTFFEL